METEKGYNQPMSTEYSDRITKEILTKVNGQSKLAEQAMLTLVKRDPKFLLSLVDPYLGGIVLHAIERAKKPQTKSASSVRNQQTAMSKTSASKTSARKDSSQNLSSKGMDGMMKAWAKSFEKDAPPSNLDGKKVSAAHIKALHALSKKTH